MTYAAVVDAWMTDLAAVSGLTTAIQHKDAPWSLEALHADQGERHLAIWAEGDPDVATAAIAGSPPSDLLVQSFVVTVWEDASSDAARLADDTTADRAWTALFEAIRARFYVLANVTGSGCLGEAGGSIHYRGGTFDLRGSVRILMIRFVLQRMLSFT